MFHSLSTASARTVGKVSRIGKEELQKLYINSKRKKAATIHPSRALPH
jgi:hypothetical protein